MKTVCVEDQLLAARAKKLGMTKSELVRELIDSYLKGIGDK